MKIEDRAGKEAQMRENLKDVLQVLHALHGTCADIGETIQLLELATGTEEVQANDGQLRILMALIARPEPAQVQTRGRA